ncbi:hypothetical protein R6Q59_006516 [Mikania micrantha]
MNKLGGVLVKIFCHKFHLQIEWMQIKDLIDKMQVVVIQDKDGVWVWPNNMGEVFLVKDVSKDIEVLRININVGRVFMWNNWATKKANIFAW